MALSMNFSFFKTLFLFLYKVLFPQIKITPKSLHKSVSNINTHSRYQKFSSLIYRSDDMSEKTLSEKTLIFNLEGALLKSSSLFPYFFLVAFEAGSVLRAFVLLLVYPLVCLVGEETGLKIMVMVCFLGIKKSRYRVGRAVMPKFFLEDVGLEPFMVLKKGGKKIATSNLPQVMIESFLKDYLEMDYVIGRELKVFHGYFVGLMEEKKGNSIANLEELNEEDNFICITDRFDKFLDKDLFSSCKEVYLVGKSDKRNWTCLPRENYPKPLVFHDGRVALRPTPSAALTLFMWMPMGLLLSIFRIFLALNLPFKLSTPILCFTGLTLTSNHSIQNSENSDPKRRRKGLLYVCNHRTLLDPLYIAFSLQNNLTAVTYSVSRLSEILAPIKTVRLTRNRDKDSELMQGILTQGDLVVCPEGTTCREPYILRFSPLFSEFNELIVPVALDAHISMFYGTTAGGSKCMDPFFFLMNPSPLYTVQVLDVIDGTSSVSSSRDDNQTKTRYDVANLVQQELGSALSFKCTNFTRKDKYMILAGNEGISNNNKRQ